jgi:hypothetical protein
MRIETTLAELYEEPKDPAPPTEEELDLLIEWYEQNVKGNKTPNSETD